MSRLALSILFRMAAAAGVLLASSAYAAPLFHASSIHYVTGTFPQNAVLGDFDGDGHLDYALVIPVSRALLTARGHGDGTFDAVDTIPGPPPYGAPKAADLNGDGYTDLAVSGSGGLAVRYGGPGGLGAQIMLNSASALAEFMDVADVNGDGRLDLVTGQDSSVVVYLATGPTTYAPPIVTPTGLGLAVDGVVVGDIDEDGKPDLLLRTNPIGHGLVAWMKGHGDGTFDPAVLITVTQNNLLFLADLNGDHHLDAVVDEGWCLGDGHGNFGPLVAFAPGGIMAVGDVTGDGAPDLIGESDPDPSLVNGASFDLYRNDGSGNFVRTWSRPVASFSAPAIGDVNGDGLNDVLAPEDAFGNATVHLSNGDGTFGSGHDYPTGNAPSGIVLAEITGDGHLDAVTSNRVDGTISVLPGLPGGQFGAPVTYAVGSLPNGIAAGDLNGDGRADIVTVDAGSNTVSVLLGQPGGGLAAAVATPAGANPVAVAIGDIDRDGHLDVVVVDQGTNTLQILKGDGAGGLTPGPSYPTTFGPSRVVIGDLDGDPWPDVVVTTFARGTFGAVDVFRGNGSGGLLPKVTYGGGGRDIAIADVNGDGIPDVVTIDEYFVATLLGTGGGALAPFTSEYRSSKNRALAIADDDADGKPDLFIAAGSVNCVWFLRGLGGGKFASAEGYGTERTPNGLAVADLDGDGTLDVVTSDGDTNLVSVLLGVSPGPVPALATLVSAEATTDGVRIEWLAGSTGSLALVERSENGAAFVRVGQIVPDASGQLTFEDPHVKQGSDYIYRLGFDRAGQTVYAGLVSVHVPVSATLSLAPGSNPALGLFSVSFSLPDTRPARLELYDVSGRRVLAREVGAMGPGTHVLRLAETSGLSSGVYWLRLVHPTKTLVARAALVK
jgi:hypothetical protein